MDIMNPKLMRMFAEKEILVNNSPLLFISPVEVIFLFSYSDAQSKKELNTFFF